MWGGISTIIYYLPDGLVVSVVCLVGSVGSVVGSVVGSLVGSSVSVGVTILLLKTTLTVELGSTRFTCTVEEIASVITVDVTEWRTVLVTIATE